MKAFVLSAPGKVEIKDMPRPRLENPYSAILQPIAMSVCTSDVNTVYGSGSKKPDDLILGHYLTCEKTFFSQCPWKEYSWRICRVLYDCGCGHYAGKSS